MSNNLTESSNVPSTAAPIPGAATQRQQPPLVTTAGIVETNRILSTVQTEHPTWKMLNQYRVGSTLGRGTHGTVKLGYDVLTSKKVAIKILKKTPRRKKLPRADKHRDQTSSTLSRIRHEVAVMKRCDHDHIVRLLEVIDDPRNQSVFLIMEHLEGGEIKWRGTERPLLSLDQTRRIVRDVLLGLEYLHYMGIIHRDIKPSNMLWTHNRMRVKLTDFGVAHFSKPVNVKDGNFSTSPGTIFSDDEDHLFKTEGTPAFYAPEQAYNQNGLEVPQFPPGQRPKGVKNNSIFPLTKALDVWAFGVTIYCLLFGKPPYWGDNIFQMCKEIIEAEYETPPQVAAEMIPLTDNDPDVREALRLMKGMMTKPVYRRMTLSEAKMSPWLTKDIENPDQWRQTTDPQATCEPIMLDGHEPGAALAKKGGYRSRWPTIVRDIFHNNNRKRLGLGHIDLASSETTNPTSSVISLDKSTLRQAPAQPRPLIRASADQPSSPLEYPQQSALSSASSPTGGNHSDSYFPNTGVKKKLARFVRSAVDITFRKGKKSNSAEAIMPSPAPLTAMAPTDAGPDILSSSCPTSDLGATMARQPVPFSEENPNFISYTSSDDDFEEDSEEGGDVQLLGFGGFESRKDESNGGSSTGLSQGFGRRFTLEHIPRRGKSLQRPSTANISDPDAEPERIYDPRYPQHTHRKSMDDSRDGTVTEPPMSPVQESVYIQGASAAPPPLPSSAPTLLRSPAIRNFGLNQDDSGDEDALEISRRHKSRTRLS